MNNPVSVTRRAGDITVTVAVPLPPVNLPDLLSKFPPKLNLGQLPNPLPPALAALGKALGYVLEALQTLIDLIPDASIRLIIKVGPATILDQRISVDDLVGIPYT